jgi:hypothetical protein
VHGSGECQLAAGVEEDVPEDPLGEDVEVEEADVFDEPGLAGVEVVVEDVLDDFEERESVR